MGMPDDERDSDQPGEQFDDEVLAGEEYPPDRPLGLGDEPAAFEGQEPEDFGDQYEDDGDAVVETGFEPDDGDQEQLISVVEDDEIGARDPDDEFSGDETTRDVVTERVPTDAEDQAMHVEPEDRQD
jgi:hypothetical protein